MRKACGAALLAAVVALVAAGCDSGSGDSGGIVSLSPTATEILFAIGAGEEVVAVDDQSNYPPDAPTSDLSGFTPNVEAIAAHEPDLVVVSNDIDDVVSGLEGLDIEVLLQPAAETLDDVYAQIRELGKATDHDTEADALVVEMQSEIDAITAAAPTLEAAPTYYYELDDQLFSVTSETFVGRLLGSLGLENIADRAEDGAGGYPRLSAEFIVDADPDFVLLADTKCCGQDAGTLAQRDGWGGLSAVTAGRVVELDDDVASRWGPRVVDLLRAAVEALEGFARGGESAAA